jgi:hypothetical protein
MESHKIVSSEMLRSSRELIIGWWQQGYLSDAGSILPTQFWREARGTLPLLGSRDEEEAGIDDLFSAIDLQRMRLRNDQQLNEWDGAWRSCQSET